MVNRKSMYQALLSARQARRITPSEYLVGCAIVRRTDAKGVCWPSLDTLAADTGVVVRTVSRAIAALKASGFITWRPRWRSRHRRQSNVYTLVGLLGQKPAARREKSLLRTTSDTESSRPLPDRLALALASLGKAIGCAPDEVAPWLRTKTMT